ncbi:hypothetical protein GM418_27755 [Maribellus comscasis]|uniref:Peptidyl-prolyl cis-trans isomerase n=1 Tax=Maribellus comscasis TaxID=2681766 RepID=A0A6I6JVY6_9BACT|nr:hypothetical protein [Maribellus comscasis]QGY47325.1 hypothetical protein GM418_27755 [Maribellus comscasis]
MSDFIKRYGLIILVGLFIFSCNEKGDKGKSVVAEVGDKKLYQNDISSVVPTGIEKEDSTVMADDYIRKWVKKELLIQKAEENLNQEQKSLNKEIEDYRNSLIIYKYKNELIKQRMDTLVTDMQIEEYYDNHQDNFNLSQNIVKAIFIKVPAEFANQDQIKLLCSNTAVEGLNELREYCLQYAKGFDIFTDNWVDFEAVLKNIPHDITDPGEFLKRNTLFELTDEDYYYLVSILDYKLRNEIAPVDFVYENIKNLILNRRKIDFLKQMEENVYTEGIRNNKFKIHKENR